MTMMKQEDSSTLKNSLVEIHDTWDGYSLIHHGKEVWKFEQYETNCCGVSELGSFYFMEKVKPNEFVETVDAFFQRERDCAFYQLTLTRPEGKKTCEQPALEAYLKQKKEAYCSPWKKNPNSDNEIQVWVIG